MNMSQGYHRGRDEDHAAWGWPFRAFDRRTVSAASSAGRGFAPGHA